MSDARKDAPSFHRNVGPITEKLEEIVPKTTLNVLEIGSGTGQHAAHFAIKFPDWSIQPTDADGDNLASIDAWAAAAGADNVKPAIALDVTQLPWSFEASCFDLVTCFNVIHITPWEVTQSLFQAAGDHMKPGAQLLLYGPFRIDGKHTSESNVKFEEWLQSKDARFGIRDVGEIEQLAIDYGFREPHLHKMPANNFLCRITRA